MTAELRQFDTVLVANRGEIACRVLRTVRTMGLASVAVYSEADAGAPHVSMADQSVCIGPAPAGDSYLRIDRILEAALATGANAVHPGYGFLAENAAFADACEQAGLVFIGPPSRAIRLMGDKAAAKKRMLAAGVPCVPGYEGEDQSDAGLTAAARAIGCPLMVKAAAGGGGRGMRLVENSGDLQHALERARSEAEHAFGSGALILEQAIVRPRHVEFQIGADAAGRVLHLGERDCSVQRRHQKVIEEAPCPVLTPALRRAMGEAAVAAAAAIDYRGAGTVEFLLDVQGSFYFLEMNTRLQVEHPVTELVTGLDLVELQIRIARGESLEFDQSEVAMRGHAIEARLYTEDPARDFMPTTGTIELWRPAPETDVRVDDGIRSGQDIGPHYDAMAAKLIAWGVTRDVARRRLTAALEQTVLFGPQTNRSFLIACLRHEHFARGEATTAFVADEMQVRLRDDATASARDAAIASVVYFRLERSTVLRRGPGIDPGLLNWSSGIRPPAHYRLHCADEEFRISLAADVSERYAVTVAAERFELQILEWGTDSARLSVDGETLEVTYRQGTHGRLWLAIGGADRLFNRATDGPSARDAVSGGGRIAATMFGVVHELAVAAGTRVEAGQRLLVMEAMKMQQEILAPVTGTVEQVCVRAGQQVATGELLLTIEEDA
jgi:geranyl-CoA carboxylase alpha subunit